MLDFDDPDWWSKLAKAYRQWKYPPMTPEMADKAYDEAPSVPISEAEIDQMVQSIVTKYPRDVT